MELELLEPTPLVAPLWTEEEMNFVAAMLSDAPDASYDALDSPVSTTNQAAKPKAKQRRRSVKKTLSPEEKAAARRASHRETMRRSRQRFRDQIAAMVKTVQELEQVKAQTLEQQLQQSDIGLQSQVAHLESQREQLLGENDALHAQLVDSLLAITRAHPNNFEQGQVHSKVKRLTNDNEKDSDQNFYAITKDKSKAPKRDRVTLCDFVTWDVGTIGHCLQLVRDSASEIARFYSEVSKDQSVEDVMGWRQLRRRLVKEETCVEFAFDKIFPNHTASEMFSKTWTFCRNQTSFAAVLEPMVYALQLQVLHQVNDDIVVVRRMQQDRNPEGENQTPIKYRSIYLLYRMSTPAGLFVVLRSVNPSFTRRCGCANNLWFEPFLWFGFSSVASTDRRESGCRVRFGGSLDGHSQDFARRWQQEITFMLLRWETQNVAPLVLVQPEDTL